VTLWRFCFDESEPGNNRRGWFVYTGVHGTTAQWRSFRREWRIACRANPGIPSFHMSDVSSLRARGQGVFARWTEDAVEAKLNALSRVLMERLEWRTGLSFRLENFWEVMRDDAVPKPYQDEYLFGFFGCLMLTVEHMQTYSGSDLPPELAFRRWTDRKRQARAEEMYHYLRESKQEYKRDYGRWLPEKPLFLDSGSDVGLEAADLIAWNYRNLNALWDKGKLVEPPAVLGDKMLQYDEWGLDKMRLWKEATLRFLEWREAQNDLS
jgi:hypothetical protein